MRSNTQTKFRFISSCNISETCRISETRKILETRRISEIRRFSENGSIRLVD